MVAVHKGLLLLLLGGAGEVSSAQQEQLHLSMRQLPDY